MDDSSRPILIVVINGSVRPGNYTRMASAYVVDELRKHPKVSVREIHPAELNERWITEHFSIEEVDRRLALGMGQTVLSCRCGMIT